MPYNRGDIVLVVFPNSDLVTAKRRPCVVIQRDDLESGLPQVVLALISSNIDRAGHPSGVTITHSSKEGRASGLRTDSVIMTDNFATVTEKRIEAKIGSLPDMTAVDVALRYTLAL